LKILEFLAANWDSAAVVLAVLGVIAYIVVKKRWDLLDKVLFALVTWAEREYGTGTGALEIAAVMEKLYPLIPAVFRVFVSTEQLEEMVENALTAAKLRWDLNPKLLESKTENK
jgi:hypothetical protein